MKYLKKEIQMLKRLEHNNIVAFYFHEETAHTLSMFMEYVPGVSSISLLPFTSMKKQLTHCPCLWSMFPGYVPGVSSISLLPSVFS